ncbi:serine/threonine-protein kinase [Micromonospora siamensis]|uniref:Uncharacterized protein n=1 Tax=Micromonospora siamensis TaxID=299152 RepID=A0A1C5JWX5_9ACTN|nr:hypothetical protein [Micromonospora siamensis]SCG75080.1 hypothetical protein GA0074704_5121 [Micromonospora siamensis]
MLLEPEIEDDVAYELCQIIGRALLPLRTASRFGTAFLFADAAGVDHLLTADLLAGAAEVGLRPSVTEPPGAADSITPAAAGWSRRPDLGVAILPMAGPHAYAREHGWRWRTQPVTDGLAAGPATLARVGAQPGSAFVLAHGVRPEPGSPRPLEVAVERVVRDGDLLVVDAALPEGYVGAPVFGVDTDADGDLGVHCLGVLLPADGARHPVAPFDRIRAAVAELPPAG